MASLSNLASELHEGRRQSLSVSVAALILGGLLSAYPCQAASKPSSGLPRVRCNLTADDFEVYVTILSDSGEWSLPLDPASIKSETLTAKDGNWSGPLGPWGRSAKPLLEQASEETRAQFAAMSAKRCFVKPFRKRDLVRNTEEEVANNKQSGRKRRAADPKYWAGIVQLSRVGFNSQKDEALVYLERYCGSLCASGDIFLLRKMNSRWGIIARINLWLS
jgi:hypothetical protein